MAAEVNFRNQRGNEHADTLRGCSAAQRKRIGEIPAEVTERTRALFDSLDVPIPPLRLSFWLRSFGEAKPHAPEKLLRLLRLSFWLRSFGEAGKAKVVGQIRPLHDLSSERYTHGAIHEYYIGLEKDLVSTPDFMARVLSHEGFHFISGPRGFRDNSRRFAEHLTGLRFYCLRDGKGLSKGTKLEEAATELLSTLSIRLHELGDPVEVFSDTPGIRRGLSTYPFECEKLLFMADMIESENRLDFFASLLHAKTLETNEQGNESLWQARINHFTSEFNRLTGDRFHLESLEFVVAFDTLEIEGFKQWLCQKLLDRITNGEQFSGT